MGAAETSPRVAAVLGPLVRVNQGPARPAIAHRHEHGVEDDLAVNRRAGGPPDDLPREEIQDDRKIEPTLPRPDIGDIRDPRDIRT